MSHEQIQSEPLAIEPRSPVREVWAQAWPTVITMTSYTVMQFVDSLMVAKVGPLEVAAQGNGGIWSFVPIAFAFGVLTVVNTFVAQNLGAGRPENGPRYAWGALWVSLIIWVVVMLPYAALMPWLFTKLPPAEDAQTTQRLVSMGAQYAQILLVGSLVLMGAKALHHYFFGMHRPRIVTFSAIVGNVVNIVANYVLIFGERGIPQWGLPGVPGVQPLGLMGAAIGTVLGTLLEFLIPLAIFLGPKMHAQFSTRAAWRPDFAAMKDLLRIGWPAAGQFGNELFCWAIFMSVLVGKFGEHHVTAGWATLRFMHLSFMPAVGFSVATTSLVGRYIGAGQPDVAMSRARLALKLSMVYMTLCAIIFFVFRHELIGLYTRGENISPEAANDIIAIGGRLMICAAVFQTVDAFGIIYTGALRGAGDTVIPGIITVVYSWLFIVGGGWALVVYAPQLESVGPWIGASVYIMVYGLTMAWRFESGAWKSIKLLTPLKSAAGKVAPLSPGPPAVEADGSMRDIAEELVDAGSDRGR